MSAQVRLFEYLPDHVSLAAPVQSWHAGLQLATMLGEAQIVIAYRMMGQCGVGAAALDEADRMVSEKPQAFAEAVHAAVRALGAGMRPDQVLAAAIAPIGTATRSNMRRLSGHGGEVPK